MKSFLVIGLCFLCVVCLQANDSTQTNKTKGLSLIVHRVYTPTDSNVKVELLNRDKREIDAYIDITDEEGTMVHPRAWSGRMRSGMNTFLLDTSLCKKGVHSVVVRDKEKHILATVKFLVER